MAKSPVTPIKTVAQKVVRPTERALSKKSIRDALVSLAGLIGCPVRDDKGQFLGKLVDVVVRHGQDAYPPVSGLIVKVGARKSFIDGARISKLTPYGIQLSSAYINLTDYQRREIGRAHV